MNEVIGWYLYLKNLAWYSITNLIRYIRWYISMTVVLIVFFLDRSEKIKLPGEFIILHHYLFLQANIGLGGGGRMAAEKV